MEGEVLRENNGVDFKSKRIRQCSIHADALYSHFCIDHETVICNNCLQDSHHNCEVISLDNAKDVVDIGSSFKNIIDRTDSLISVISIIIQKKNENISSLRNTFEETKTEIQTFRKNIIDSLDRLEKDVLELLENKIRTLSTLLENERHDLELQIAKLKPIKESTNDKEEFNLSTFHNILDMNRIPKEVEDYLKIQEDIQQWHRIEFKWTKSIDDIPKVYLNFGSPVIKSVIAKEINDVLKSNKNGSSIIIDLNRCRSKPVSTEYMTETKDDTSINRYLSFKYKFDTLKFGNNVQINRGCFISSGSILAKDMKSNYLYMLNVTDDTYQTLTLEHEALDVAAFDKVRAVVTLREGGIQIVHIPEFELGNRIKCDGSFYAVSCLHDEIFVRSPYRKLMVININGDHLRTIETEFAIDHMSMNENGVIYCTNYYRNRIFALTTDGTPVFSFELATLRGPVGVAIDKDNNFYVAGWISNDIHQFDGDGNILKIIGSEKDEISRPMDLSYNKDDNSLMVVNRGCISITIYEIKDGII